MSETNLGAGCALWAQCATSAFRRIISIYQTLGPFFLVHFRGQNPESFTAGLSNQMEPSPFSEKGNSGRAGTRIWVCALQVRDPSAPDDLSSGVWDGVRHLLEH